MLPRLYKVNEAADYLSVKVTTIRTWLNTGKLSGVKIAGNKEWRVREADLEDFVNNGPRASGRGNEIGTD
jgi:excisionase family DNA binding protein